MSKRVEQLNQKRFVRTKNWTPSGIKPTTLKNTHGMVCLKFKLKFYLLYSQESIAVRGSTTSKVRVKQGNFGSKQTAMKIHGLKWDMAMQIDSQNEMNVIFVKICWNKFIKELTKSVLPWFYKFHNWFEF